jgi:hypothetical protein
MRGYRKYGLTATIVAELALLEPPRAMPAPFVEAPSASDAAMIEELQAGVDERDTVIRDLLERVEKLERVRPARASVTRLASMEAPRRARSMDDTTATEETTGTEPVSQLPSMEQAATQGQAPEGGMNPGMPAALPGPAPAKPESAALPRQASLAPQQPPAATPPAPTPAAAARLGGQQKPQEPQKPPEPEKPGPGEFVVNEDDAKHALERALVQTGAALLPSGAIEFVPSITYQFRRDSRPGQIALTTDGTVLITETVTRSTQAEAGVVIRAGLPFGMQAELGFPWDYKNLAVVSRANGGGLSEHSIGVQGMGDPTVSLTKQLLTEGDVRPGVFFGGSWNSNLGQVKSGIPLGTGFDEFSVGLTAVKRQDPLVFTAGFNYQMALEHNGFQPGDQYTPSLGILFAISPETSLRFSQQLSIGGRDKFHGVSIPGSEKMAGTFSFGLVSVLGRGQVVNLTGGIGETPDAPNFFFNLAFPTRVN